MDFGGSGDINIGVGGDISPLKQALDQIPVLARQAGEAAAAALSQAASGGGAASGAFSDAAKATQQLSDAMNTAVGAAAALDKELQQKPTDTGAAAQSFQDLGTQLRDAGSAMVLIGGVLTGVSAALIELGESSLMAAGKMEQQRVAMVNLSGSAEKTDKLIKDLVEFAIKTPFEIPGVIEMGQKLVAMGTATQDVIPLLRTLGDTASGSGKGFAGLNVLVQDFGKMSQLGVVHMRELNTLAYQGVPAIQALADAFGVSTHRMRQMVEQNLIQASDALPILTKAMADKFGGMMEAQSKTLLGMWSNFKDSITKTFIAIGDALIPAFKGIINAIQPLLDTIQQIAQWFGKLPEPVQSAVVAIGLLVIAIGPLVLAAGGFLFVAGQIITTLPALAATVGVELPAAFTRGTIAVVANTEALAANAIAARAAGTALSTTVVEGAGAAAVAIGVLKTAVSIALPILGALATAFVAGKLIASILETIPYVKQLQQAWADQAMAQTGAVSGAMAQGSVAYFKTLGESARGASAGLDLAATGLRNLQTAQADANQAVKVAKDVMDAAKAALDGSAEAGAVYTRAVIAYEDALKKANPTIKEHGKALRDASTYTSEAGAALDKYSAIVGRVTGFVSGSMDEFRRAIIDGMNPGDAIKNLDNLIASMRALGESGDTVASGLADMFEQSRKKIIDMLLALDPTKMQQFNVNGVQVLKSGISGLGASADDMAARMAKALRIPEEAAAKLVNAWKIGMRDAQQSMDGFTTTLVKVGAGADDVVKMITPATEAIKRHGDAAEHAGRQLSTMQQAQELMNNAWRIGSDNAGRVVLGVQQLIIEQKNLDNELKVAKDILERVNDLYKKGAVNIEVLAKAEQKYESALQASGKASNASGDSIYRADGSLKSFNATMYDALGRLNDLKNSSSIMAGSFMEGMNGMIVSGQTFIVMLKQAGALTSQIANAARALGYEEIGNDNFVSPEFRQAFKNKERANFEDLFGDLASSFGDAAEILKAKMKADAAAMEDHTKSVKETTGKYDDLLITVNGMIMTVKEYNELGKKITDNIVNPLMIGSKEASDALGGLSDAATDASGNLSNAFSDASRSTQNWSDFIQDHADLLPQIQGTIRDALIKVGNNFYDAADMAERLAYGLDAASDVIVRAAIKLGSVDKEFSSDEMTALQAERKRVYEAELSAYQNMRKVIGELNPGVQTMTYPDIPYVPTQAFIAPRISPGASQSPGSGYIGPVGLGGVSQSGGGVNVYVTGNNILDQRTANDLTNRIATQMTQILRQNAGLKV
jgi:tape measure domain-containing protein